MTPQNKLCFVPKGESDKTLFLPHSLAFVCSPFSSFFVFLLHVTIFLEVEVGFSLVDILGHLELAGFWGLVSQLGLKRTLLWLLRCEGVQAAGGSFLLPWLLPSIPPGGSGLPRVRTFHWTAVQGTVSCSSWDSAFWEVVLFRGQRGKRSQWAGDLAHSPSSHAWTTFDSSLSGGYKMIALLAASIWGFLRVQADVRQQPRGCCTW